jgi:hypothetical protein
MPTVAPTAATPAWAVAIAAALVLLVPVSCWAALQVNATYRKIMDDHSHMRSSLHALVNTSTAIQGQLELTKRIAQENQNAVATLAGGAAGTVAVAPLNQHDAALPTGGIDPAWATDCGETCVAMLVAAKKGVPIGIARIRYLLGKPNTDGRTTGSDLVRALAMCDLAAHERAADATTSLTEIKRNLDVGRTSIVLGNWVSPNMPHWMVALRYNEAVMYFDDPWIGAERALTYADYETKYKGEYVHMDE